MQRYRFRVAVKNPTRLMEGRLRPSALKKKEIDMHYYKKKKNKFAPTTLQSLVELTHRSLIIPLTFKK